MKLFSEMHFIFSMKDAGNDSTSVIDASRAFHIHQIKTLLDKRRYERIFFKRPGPRHSDEFVTVILAA
jgi:hypothetical protein